MLPLTADFIFSLLPARRADAHKGSFGAVLAVAGSMAYRGAAALCVEGALRGGAGLVYLAAIEPVVQLVLARTPECCACGCRTGADGCILPKDAAALCGWAADKHPVLLAGPGLGDGAGPVVTALLKGDWRGVVLDADALNALAAGRVRGRVPPCAVLTPHPGEAARLLNTTPAAVQADRESAAAALAKQYGCTVVLKGAGTLIAAPEGVLYRNTTGNPGLARGGSGDVLAGLLAALLAQGLAPADAAACAVWLHGAAADRCAARTSQMTMLPHDILTDLPAVLAKPEKERGEGRVRSEEWRENVRNAPGL